MLIAALCAMLIVCSKGSRQGAAQGVTMCLNVLAPSLFPMMAVTNLFVYTGLCRALGKPLQKPARVLFGISGAMAPVLVMGLLGGYPVGAAGIAALRRQNAVGESEAKRAALFSVCAGPGFLLNFVGAAVYQSQTIGSVLFAAQVTSVLLTSLAARLFYREKAEAVPAVNASAPMPFSQALVTAVGAAAKGMAAICAFVVLFSALTGAAAQVLQNKAAVTALTAVTEVCGAVARLSGGYPLEAVAFAVGFGGICVHCQIFAALENIPVSKGLFFLFRIMQGLITAAMTHLLLRLLPKKEAVFSTVRQAEAPAPGGSVLVGAVLVFVAVCFWISVKQARYNNK